MAAKFSLRDWCSNLYTGKEIRIACSDWTALEIEFEKLLEEKSKKTDDELLSDLGLKYA